MSHLRETGIKKLSTILDNDIAMGIKAYCKEKEIEFDSYGYYDKTGITVLVDTKEEERINALIDYLDEIKIKNSLFFKKYGIDFKESKEFISFCIEKGKFWGFFDKELYDKKGR